MRLKCSAKQLGLLLLLMGQTMPVGADCTGIGCSCSVVALPVAFGNYNPTSSLSTDATGTITVTCGAIALGANISYEIRLSKGNSTSFSPRQLKNGSNALSYNLYTNTARSLIWGDTTGGTVSVSDGYILAIISNAINYTVYGRIPASQNVAAGLYSDTIVVSVIY